MRYVESSTIDLNLALGKLPSVMIFIMMKCSHEYNMLAQICRVMSGVYSLLTTVEITFILPKLTSSRQTTKLIWFSDIVIKIEHRNHY